MKITGVSSFGTGANITNGKATRNKRNVSFGYNIEVNNSLIEALGKVKRNKAYYNYIKEMVTATNQAELSLRDAEKKEKKVLIACLSAAFVPMKIMLTNVVNALFPALNYRNKEIGSYTEEIDAKLMSEEQPPSWMNTLVDVLTEHEKQDEAQKMADVLSSMMHEIFPGQQFDFSGLTPMFREHYIDNEDDVDDVNDVESEETNTTVLSDSAKLGKSKVDEYVPTAMSEQGFASLGGMKELKETLNDRIVGVLKDPIQARLDNIEYGKKIPKGLLLYGPPGTGKTTVVEHLSTEAGVPLLKLKTGKLKTSYWHETSKNIDAAFDYAESIATPEKPVLMMIDDADSFFVARSGRTEQFQAEEMTTFLDRIQNAAEHNVMVVATTNKYDVMDDAIRSRFDEQIYVGLPDLEARTSILKMLLNQRTKGKVLAENEEDLEKVAKKLDSFAIREIIGITNRAAMLALKDDRRDISVEDFEKIIAESQNLKVKEELYKTNATRKSIGF